MCMVEQRQGDLVSAWAPGAHGEGMATITDLCHIKQTTCQSSVILAHSLPPREHVYSKRKTIACGTTLPV